jgi:hypothetical protein
VGASLFPGGCEEEWYDPLDEFDVGVDVGGVTKVDGDDAEVEF